MSFLVRKKKAERPVPDEEPEVVEADSDIELTVEDTSAETEAVDESSQPSGDDGPSTDERVPEPKEKEEVAELNVEPDAESENQVRNDSLRNLQLAGNGLNDDFVESMLRIFGESSALEELNLFGNRMTDRSIDCIVQKLSELKKLRYLWLGHNLFSTMGARALVEGMRNNFVLEELNIRSLESDAELETIQNELDYYARLNRGGRRIFASDVSRIPMSLWPLILARANRIHSALENYSHVADSIFCLLHGPALLDNHALVQSAQRGVL